MKPLQLNISIEFGVFTTNYYMKLIWDYSCDENINATDSLWSSDFYGTISLEICTSKQVQMKSSS